MPTHPPSARLSQPDDGDLARYQALSLGALAGLLAGVASLVVLADPSLVWAPAAAAALNLWALWRIRRNRTLLTGQGLAWAGLWLSMAMLLSVPAEGLVYRWMVRREACRFAELWVRLLCDGQMAQAHQLTRAPDARAALDDHLRQAYQQSDDASRELEAFVSQTAVERLLGTGPKAKVSCQRIVDQQRLADRDLVSVLMAVAQPDRGEEKTLHFTLNLQRVLSKSRGNAARLGQAGWMMVRVDEAGPPVPGR